MVILILVQSEKKYYNCLIYPTTMPAEDFQRLVIAYAKHTEKGLPQAKEVALFDRLSGYIRIA